MENEWEALGRNSPTHLIDRSQADNLFPIRWGTRLHYASKFGVEVEQIVFDPDYDKCDHCGELRTTTVAGKKYSRKCFMEVGKRGH